jgi:hypothetical protein
MVAAPGLPHLSRWEKNSPPEFSQKKTIIIIWLRLCCLLTVSEPNGLFMIIQMQKVMIYSLHSQVVVIRTTTLVHF